MARRKTPGDFAVGYGRPPIASRFKPGQSGNPRGRPKAVHTLDEALRHRLAMKVAVTEGGRRKRVTLLEVIVGRLTKEAAAGDPRATALLLILLAQRQALAEGDGGAPRPSPDEDMAALKTLIDSMGGSFEALITDLVPGGTSDDEP